MTFSPSGAARRGGRLRGIDPRRSRCFGIPCPADRERGWEKVAAVVDEASIATVNLGEVVGVYARRGAVPAEIRQTLRLFSVHVVPVDEELAIEAGMLWTSTSRFGLSLGDRICLALGRREGVKVLTADRIWVEAAAGIGVEVELIR